MTFALFLVTAVCVLGSWQLQPGLWQSLGNDLVARVNEKETLLFEQALNLSDDKSYPRLAALVEDLEHVQKNDALDALKRRVFSSLVSRAPRIQSTRPRYGGLCRIRGAR